MDSNDKKKIVIIALITAAVIPLYFFTKVILWTYHVKKNLQQHKNLILIETNHDELLSACRNILKNQTNNTCLEEADWPLIIKELQPSFVLIDGKNRCMDIAIGGGFYTFGVIAFEEGSDISLADFNTEDCHYKQLVEGLWYYEEG